MATYPKPTAVLTCAVYLFSSNSRQAVYRYQTFDYDN